MKVALNGDAGDELFGGYDRYRLMPLMSTLALVPGAPVLARGVARSLGAALPPKLVRLLEAVASTPEESYARIVSYFSSEQKAELYTPAFLKLTDGASSVAILRDRYESCDARDLIGRTLCVDTHTYLPGDLLVKVDIATMASSLEGRSPFLDHSLVEFAARLPTRYKVGSSGSKRVLRRAVADLLPDSILARRKQGFGVPISRWFRGELRPFVRDVLLAGDARSAEPVRREAVESLVLEHESRRRDHGNRLWALLMLELWLRRFQPASP